MDQITQKQLDQAAAAIKAGDTLAARTILVDLVKTEPSNAHAWYLLSFAADDDDQALYCIKQAAQFAPTNRPVQLRLVKLQGGAVDSAVIPGYQAPRPSASSASTHSSRAAATAAPSVPFYREPLFKVLAFLFMFPVWVLVILTDPRESQAMKIIAVILMVVACLFGIWIGVNVYSNMTAF